MPEKAAPPQKKKAILLVDDSKLILQMEEAILGREQFDLFRATSGQQALDLVKRHKPLLVLLDFFLPDVNGDEVTKRIREDPETTHVSIIIVTMKGSDEQKEKCFKAGCNDFITKPINSGLLKLKVDRLVNIAPRTPYRILVKMSQAGSEQRDFVFSSSVNISETGMLVETDKKFDLGTEVDLQFYVTSSREPIAVRGLLVRYQKKGFRRANAYGITFSELSEENRKKIRALIEQKARP
ncbi:MAG: response regulator [Acidobacteriota bacterium]|nr:MAG: response regulator [Acidobacteriota bacterium]